jgi:hypothetical protein
MCYDLLRLSVTIKSFVTIKVYVLLRLAKFCYNYTQTNTTAHPTNKQGKMQETKTKTVTNPNPIPTAQTKEHKSIAGTTKKQGDTVQGSDNPQKKLGLTRARGRFSMC